MKTRGLLSGRKRALRTRHSTFKHCENVTACVCRQRGIRTREAGDEVSAGEGNGDVSGKRQK